MNRLLITSIGLLSLSIAACGGSSGGSSQGPVDPTAAGLLSPVTDVAAFEESLKAGMTAMSSSDQLSLEGAAADGNFTGTYTQEVNVDEFDVVRYDGSHLYVAPRQFFHCCFLLAEASLDGASSTGLPPQDSIRILSTDPQSGAAQPVAAIDLEDGVSVQGMYLADDRMVALTAQSIYGKYGDLWAAPDIWAPEQFGFRVYDVSDVSQPSLEVEASITGILVESRRIGNTVYVVSRYTPFIDNIYYYVTSAAEQAQNQQLLANVSVEDLLPKITIDGATQALVRPDRCYVTTDDDDPVGYPILTSITAIPIDDPAAFSTTCYNEDAYGAYVSESALYLTESRPAFAVERDTTRIHKFALSGTDVRYRGSADIDGLVWRGGQHDFRMSEHQGDLRVLASEYDWNNEDFVDHRLHVLREANTTARLDLTVVSTLPNDARPEEIGKPNEALYGVRFLADRAYAVTFRQIDPLYVLDLADPADPFIAGELEVTGFSDFLHPVSDDLLLGLGQGANGGVKLELFDVSEISDPLSRGSATLGGRGSWSEALYDRHAFTYQADVNGIDRVAVPANLYSLDGNYDFYQSGLYLFEIRDKSMPSVASLASAGSILPPVDGVTLPYYSSRNRTFIHDDTVYYVRDEDVWSAFWQSPTIVNGPF